MVRLQTTRHLRSLTGRRAFTIVEILVVLAIIVLFLGISLPAVMTIVSGRALQGAGLATQTALQRARNAAIANRCYVTLIFEFVKGGQGAKKGQDVADHYRIRITGHGPKEYVDLPDGVIVGSEVVEVLTGDANLNNPPHSYPLIFSPDGSLVRAVQRGGTDVNLWDLTERSRVIILRDSASEPFTDVPKTYFGNELVFANGVYDRYGGTPDRFLEGNPTPEQRKLIDRNMNGLPDSQLYVSIDPYTGRIYTSDAQPDQWY